MRARRTDFGTGSMQSWETNSKDSHALMVGIKTSSWPTYEMHLLASSRVMRWSFRVMTPSTPLPILRPAKTSSIVDLPAATSAIWAAWMLSKNIEMSVLDFPFACPFSEPSSPGSLQSWRWRRRKGGLPAPLGPTRATNSPGKNVPLLFCRTVLIPFASPVYTTQLTLSQLSSTGLRVARSRSIATAYRSILCECVGCDLSCVMCIELLQIGSQYALFQMWE